MLSKVKTYKIKNINLNKGKIIKLLNKKEKIFKGFGECYLNEVKKNNVKGWNYHKKIPALYILFQENFYLLLQIILKIKKLLQLIKISVN